MANKDLDDAVRQQMPGWKEVKTPKLDSATLDADSVKTPTLSGLKKKYAKDADADAAPAAAAPDSPVDSVVLEKGDHRKTFDFDKNTKKFVTGQG